MGAAVFLSPGFLLLASTNDDFASRISLTGTNLVVSGANTNATKQADEPDHAGNSGGQSVWWTWTAPTDGEVVIKTEGSSFDTLLAVYLGNEVAALTLVAASDDHGVLRTGRVRFGVVAGSQYQIAVDGYSDDLGVASGDITLALDFVSEPIFRPPNDDFINRLTLAGSSVMTQASNAFATREPGEPLHAGTTGDASVWWSWTAPTTGPVTITTEGSTVDTLLAVYGGTILPSLTELGSNDDVDLANGVLTSAVTMVATAGQTLQIAVDGFGGDFGEITLRIEPMILRLVATVPLPDGGFQFTLETGPGTTNEIQTSPDLRSWTAIATLIATNGTALYTDQTATNRDHSFYRVRLLP